MTYKRKEGRLEEILESEPFDDGRFRAPESAFH